MPVTIDDKLKVINLEMKILGLVILLAAKVQRLLKTKLEIMASSEAIALAIPFK